MINVMAKTAQVIILLFVISIGGCASIHQTFIDKSNDGDITHGPYSYKRKVYIGIRTDGQIISAAFTRTGWEFLIWPFALVAAVDMPLSLVADTLFLPYTATSDQNNGNKLERCRKNKDKQATQALGGSWKDDDVWCTKEY